MVEKKQLVVVLSRNYSTGVSVIRSLGTLGYTIDLVASAQKAGDSVGIASSKYIRRSVEVVTVKEDSDQELLDELLKYGDRQEEKSILFPTDDYTTSIMDKNRNVLGKYFLMPSAESRSLIQCMDKTFQSEMARKVGLRTPKEWVFSLEKMSIPEDMIYPCFCKAITGITGDKTEITTCNSEEELRAHLNKLKEKNSKRSVLVQEYFSIKEEIGMAGVCFDQKIIIPAITKKLKVAQYEKGVAIIGQTFPYENLGDTDHKIKELLKEFHYIGMFNIALNVVGNEIYFGGINFHSEVTNYAYFASGVNLPGIFVKELFGEKHLQDEANVAKYGKIFVYEDVAWKENLHGYMTREELVSYISEADITLLYNADDPVPQKFFIEKIEKAAIRQEAKEKCITFAMETAGWDRKQAEEEVKATKERLGITYKDYRKYNFSLLTAEEQEKTYIKIQENRKQRKEDCITEAMEEAGWTREEAERQIEEVRERLGITYAEYRRHQFAILSAEEQTQKMEKILKNRKKKLVVVLSRNYSTGLSVIRSLGAAGYKVDLIASAHKEGALEIASASKYVHRSVEVVSKKVKAGEDTALMHELMRYARKFDERVVLFPTDDYTTAIIDQNRSELEKNFVLPTIVSGKDGCLTASMDKTFQGELARKVGLCVPKEWVFSLEEEIVIPEDIIYPCFCKPIESITGYKKEMAMCKDEVELKSHLNKLRRSFEKRSILVQEYLKIDYEIDMSGVCLNQKIIIPAIIKKTHVAQYEKGVTLAGKVVPFEEIGEIQQQVIDMMKEFHYVGMFDMEFNVVGDKIYFNEVNLRSGGPNYSYFKSGVNLPALFVKEAMGKRHTPEEEQVKEYGKTFIYEKVAWEDYMHGFMTKKELDECIERADIKLLCDESDPAPGELFRKEMEESKIKRKLRRIKEKVKKKLLPRLRVIKPILLRYPQTKKRNRRNPDSERPRVLITGRNYCSNLCMARSMGKAGYEVEILRIFQTRPKITNLLKILKPDAYSKYVKAYYVCISRRKSQRIVNKLKQLADPNHKMLLIPADDLMACIADDYLEELEEYYILPNVANKAGEINRLMSKGVQKELAKEAGLPIVNSCVIETKDGAFDIPKSVTYPCFMKPNISKNSSKSRMRKCNNEEELREALTELSEKKDIEMLVEDFVEIEKEYSILGVSTKKGAIGPGFFVAEEGGQKEHRGVALIGKTLPCSQRQELIGKLVAFVGTLKFDGLYDIDLIETKEGKLYFVELNMRFGASGYAFTESGVNLPGMFADYMVLHKPIDMNCKIVETGKKFVSEKVLIEEYTMGRIPTSKIKNGMKEAEIHFVQNDQDKRPYRHFRKFYLIAAIMRIGYKMKEAKENKSES